MIDQLKDQKVTLIATDGGLRYMPAYLVADLLKKGWRRVDNPKRNYYAEFDQTSPFYRADDAPPKERKLLHIDMV